MFKVNPDGMRMEPTPERVLSVCRLVAHKSMPREEVRKTMTLGLNDEKGVAQINASIDVALKELSLINAENEILKLAVDPSVIPLGSKLYIETSDGGYVYGYATAEDTGGAIKGNKVDLFFPTYNECMSFGRRSVKVYILE